MLNTILTIGTVLLMVVTAIHLWVSKKNERTVNQLREANIFHERDMLCTLALGLFYRFHKVQKDEHSLFIKNEAELSRFAADIFISLHGGKVYFSNQSANGIVAFEQSRRDGIYYFSIENSACELTFEPIALLHSHVEKWGADGGYVITLGTYSQEAKEYANGLNIEIVNGIELTEMWVETLKQNYHVLSKHTYGKSLDF